MTGVLTNVRMYMVYYLLQNNKLSKTLSTKINKSKNFFKLGSRKDIENTETQTLVNNVIELFMFGSDLKKTQVPTKKIKDELLEKIDNTIKALSSNEDSKYIVLGILLNHKTQGDEM